VTTRGKPLSGRFCDLVMKGGITSGIVYPAAIAKLSESYFFQNIGGTSAGAIAAAISAAAEFNRRRHESDDGFDLLRSLPRVLGAPAAAGDKRSKLMSLFQAEPATKRLFSVLMSSLNAASTLQRIGKLIRGVIVAYWLPVLVAAILFLAMAWSLVRFGGLPVAWALLTSLPILVLALSVFVGTSVYYDISRRMGANGYGLCTGMGGSADLPALTPWLHQQIQRAAGLKQGDRPLTFGDLWNANDPSSCAYRPTGARCIDLQMFSTNLTQGRPYIFPLPPRDKEGTTLTSTDRLFFKRDELKRYLPPDVLDHLVKCSNPYQRDSAGKGPPQKAGKDLLELPEPQDFPVLLAARMSLSFPLLFAAVPLWGIDYSAPDHDRRSFRKCWFSDGGISSNFPIHLFDALLPKWPTFGIDLEPVVPTRPEEMVYLPQKYSEGFGERWDGFGESKKSTEQVGGFISAIASTMQNWNDNSLARMPGVRDRIARVRLRQDEGGLNLNMSKSTIDQVAARGERAAEALLQRFAARPPDGTPAAGWDEQRFVRLCVLLRLLAERVPGLLDATGAVVPYATSYLDLIDQCWRRDGEAAPPGYAAALSQQEKKALEDVVAALGRIAAQAPVPFAASGFNAVPAPELRVRPPL
jgi:predicted acylesterase/phospholipase RssA